MARIFRALLIAAVNAIQEFFAFATDNGESQVGDSVKLNDGMATSNYDWSAYPSDTEITGDYTQTGTIEKVKQIGNDFVYGMQEPEQDNKDVTINTGEIYYGWTDGTNTYYTTTEDIYNDSHLYDSNFNDITSQHTIEANTFVQPILTASGTMGGDSFAVSAQYLGVYYDWYPFASNANTNQAYTWAKSGNSGNYDIYNPTAFKIQSIEITNRNEGSPRSINGGTVKGSNDYSTWTDITTFTNSTLGQNQTWTIDVNSSVAYKYYRLSVTSNDSSYIGIGKIKINATSEILIDGNLVTSTSSIVKDITSNIEIIDNTTIQTVTITSDQTAEIETSTSVTTDNNGVVITDGSRHNFNITVPSSFVSIMQSGGQQYNITYCPYTFKANTGVGLLLKNGDNVYYRNTWIMNRDYDLHYQQINFSYPSGAIVTCKVNNVLQNDLTPYCYAGDIVTWTCDNAGTVMTGSYTVKYSSKDGNIQTITIS